MSIQINNNTVVRLLVRRGYDSDRRQATLAEGELGFTVDTQRMFVGDGITVGGIVAANKFHGFVSSRSSITDVQLGDTCYETSSQVSLVYTTSGWVSNSPGLGTGSLEYGPNGIRIATSTIGTSLNLAYSSSDVHNIYGNLNSIELDSRYWSLCTTNYFNSGGFYLGNTSGLSNGLYAYRLGVDGPVSIFTNGQTGKLVLSGGSLPTIGSHGQKLTFSCDTNSASSFHFKGGSVLIDQNLLVAGTLSAYAILTSNTTSITSVSTFTVDLTTAASNSNGLLVVNYDSDPQTMVAIKNNNSQLFICKNTPFIGLNTDTDARFATANNLLSGSTIIINDTDKAFAVQQLGGGPITLNSYGGRLSACATSMILSATNLTIYGDVSATGDIIAFAPSDVTLKDNITQIQDPLAKLLSIRGVEFDWNSRSKNAGHDMGVLAQEVEQIIPTAVGVRHDGYKGVRYERLVPLLIEAIRELSKRK